MDTNSFIEKAKKIWGNKFDYSETVYIRNDKKIKIKYNGIEFYQTPKHHLEGHLPLFLSGKHLNNTEDFIKKSIIKHNHKYDYSKVDYKNSHTKVCIICPKHGEFWQTPTNHLSGNGCPKCKFEKLKELFTSNNNEFTEKSKKIHDNQYDYSKVDYKNSHTKVCIICPKHGEFWQIPNNHLKGETCPKCAKVGISNIENEIFEYINIHNKEFIKNDKTILNGNEIDIYNDKIKIGFEIDGLYWHNEINKPDKNYHLNKTIECENKGIKLIHIFEDEWIYKKQIWKSMISNILIKTNYKIYARKCEIREINDSKIVSEFLNTNHIQGKCGSSIKLGLYYNNELVSLMTFGNLRKNLGQKSLNGKYELLRFCNKLNTVVIGGASKLFNYFIKKYNPESIVSYADRRWSQGNLYEKLGFKFVKNTFPNYYYIINKKRYNRFNFRKDQLIKKYNCPSNITERQFCFEHGWYRIYDCGSKVFLWNKIS